MGNNVAETIEEYRSGKYKYLTDEVLHQLEHQDLLQQRKAVNFYRKLGILTRYILIAGALIFILGKYLQ